MRSVLIFLTITFLLAGCASPDQHKPLDIDKLNVVKVASPGDEEVNPSIVYVDSINVTTSRLMVHGSFPDGCTKLKTAEYRFGDNFLKLVLEGWRNPDELCTQALTPFTFVYENIPMEEVSAVDSVIVNDKSYPVKYL